MNAFQSQAELLKYLVDMFPFGITKADKVFAWLRSNTIEHSTLTNGVIYASIGVRKFFFFKKKLLMQFHFGTKQELTDIKVSESYTGL